MEDCENGFTSVDHEGSETTPIPRNLMIANGTKIGIIGGTLEQANVFTTWLEKAIQLIEVKSEHTQAVSWQDFSKHICENFYSFDKLPSDTIIQEASTYFSDLKYQGVTALVISLGSYLTLNDKLALLFAEKHQFPLILVTNGAPDFKAFKRQLFHDFKDLQLKKRIFEIKPDMPDNKKIVLLQHILSLNSNPIFDLVKNILKKFYDSIISIFLTRESQTDVFIENQIQFIVNSKRMDEEMEDRRLRLKAIEEKKQSLAQAITESHERILIPQLSFTKKEVKNEIDAEEEKYKEEWRKIEEEERRILDREKELERVAAEDKLQREAAVRLRKEKMQLAKEVMEKEVQNQDVTSPQLTNVLQQFQQNLLKDNQEREKQVKAAIARLSIPSFSPQASIEELSEIAYAPKPMHQNIPVNISGDKPNIGVIGLPNSGRKTLIGALAGGLWTINSNPLVTPNYNIYQLSYPGVIARDLAENIAIYDDFFSTMQLQNLSGLLIATYGSLRENDFFIIMTAQKYRLPIAIVRTKLDEWLDNSTETSQDYVWKDKEYIQAELKKENITGLNDKIFNISALACITVAEEGSQCSMSKYLQDEIKLESFLKTFGSNTDWEMVVDKNPV